jgi:glutamine synthetase
MLTLEQLKGMVAKGEIETVLAGFTDHYGRLMGKRFDAEMFVEEIAAGGGHACDYLLTVDMEMEPVPGYSFANWELGYGDVHMLPDLATLRIATWLDKTAFVLCDVKSEKTHDDVAVAPRSILRRQVDAAKKLGYTGYAGTELEHYLFQTSYRQAAQQDYRNLEPAGWYLEDYHMLQGTRTEGFHAAARRHLKLSGVPVENSKGEWGKGQHELNVRYAEVLDMADRHVVFKQAFKEIAEAMGMSVTFMAKFAADGAGSSCHIHFSLWRDKKNVFEKGGELFRWFLGGWIAHARELSACYAPYPASYKRYQSRSWAPTGIAWSYDNRTAGFRVVGRGPSLRVECRIPGADANPYVAYAAAIAAGLDGIENQIEPPPIFQGDIYAARELPRIPGTLYEAIAEFERSEFARSAFGDDVYEHYLHFIRTEQRKFDEVVTSWERARYFERA